MTCSSVTAFDVDGARLGDRSVAPSGGQFPSSVAVHDDLVYVLNAGGDGSLTAARTYATGGLGGTEVNAPLDALASQSS